MKPTFRKRYVGPGYWTARRPAPRRPWNWLSFAALFRDIYAVVRARQNDTSGVFYHMHPSRGRHGNDLLRLPLGAAIRPG